MPTRASRKPNTEDVDSFPKTDGLPANDVQAVAADVSPALDGDDLRGAPAALGGPSKLDFDAGEGIAGAGVGVSWTCGDVVTGACASGRVVELAASSPRVATGT